MYLLSKKMSKKKKKEKKSPPLKHLGIFNLPPLLYSTKWNVRTNVSVNVLY